MAYTPSTVEKRVARLFVATTKLTDTQCNNAITSGKCPSAGWVQIETADGGVVFTQERNTTDLVTQQRGTVDVAVDSEMGQLQITIAAAGLNELEYLMQTNTANTTGDALSGLPLRENRGALLSTSGVSFFVEDKSTDTTEGNSPAITGDSEALLLFLCVPTSPATYIWNNQQNSVTMTFRCLANSGSGSARGFYGRIGAFTAGA